MVCRASRRCPGSGRVLPAGVARRMMCFRAAAGWRRPGRAGLVCRRRPRRPPALSRGARPAAAIEGRRSSAAPGSPGPGPIGGRTGRTLPLEGQDLSAGRCRAVAPGPHQPVVVELTAAGCSPSRCPGAGSSTGRRRAKGSGRCRCRGRQCREPNAARPAGGRGSGPGGRGCRDMPSPRPSGGLRTRDRAGPSCTAGAYSDVSPAGVVPAP